MLSCNTAVFLGELKYSSCWSQTALRVIGVCCRCCTAPRARVSVIEPSPQDGKRGGSNLAIHAGSEHDGGPESSPESGSIAPSPAVTPRRVDTTRARVCVVGSPRRDPVQEMFSPQSHASDSPLLQAGMCFAIVALF